jgi:hypothetical protein
METRITVNKAKTEELKKTSTDLATTVYDLTVTDAVTCQRADELVKACTKLEKAIKDFFADSKKTAHDLHKKIIAMEKEQLEPVTNMKKHLKSVMTTFIAQEESYNDALHTFSLAVALGDEVAPRLSPDYPHMGAFEDALETARKSLQIPREEVDPYDFNDEAVRAYAQIQKARYSLDVVDIVEPEIKKADTSLRKLSLNHDVDVASMRQLVEAVASGKAPIEWLAPDLSAIKKTAKDYETVEAFYAKYPKTGVMLRINRSVR